MLKFGLIAAAFVCLIPVPALAHGGRWTPPPPLVPRPEASPGKRLPSGENLPPGWTAPGKTEADPVATPTTTVPRIHWSRWWFLNRDSLLDLERVRGRRRAGTGVVPEPERKRLLDALLAAARSEDPDLATGAIVALGRAQCEAARPFLRERAVAAAADRTVRESAILALGMVGGGETRAFLSKLLGDADRPARERGFAAIALGVIGDMEALPSLLAAAGDKARPIEVRTAAALAAGRVRGEMVAADLVRLVGGEGVPDPVRAHAAAALGRHPSKETRSALLKAWGGGSKTLRPQAALSLGAVLTADDGKAVASLTDPPEAFALIAMGEIGAPFSRAALLRAYRRGDPVLAAHAAIALGLFARNTEDETARAKVLALLRSQLAEFGDSDLTAALAIAAAIARDEKITRRLRELLADVDDPRVKAHVAVALGVLGVREIGPELLKIAGAAKDPFLIRETVFALELLADREAAVVLIPLLRNGKTLAVRGAAASSAGLLHSSAAAEALVSILQDPKEANLVRALAAVGLGHYLEKEPSLAWIGTRLDYTMVNGAVAESLSLF